LRPFSGSRCWLSTCSPSSGNSTPSSFKFEANYRRATMVSATWLFESSLRTGWLLYSTASAAFSHPLAEFSAVFRVCPSWSAPCFGRVVRCSSADASVVWCDAPAPCPPCAYPHVRLGFPVRASWSDRVLGLLRSLGDLGFEESLARAFDTLVWRYRCIGSFCVR
jgi:hypothetical protein